MPRPYQTTNIEQAATIEAVTGFPASLSFNESGLATFAFPSVPEVAAVVYRYESGGVQADARKLLNTRNQLYRRIRGGGR